MPERHPTHFKVTARRNNLVVWVQDAATRVEAEELKKKYESVQGTEAEIEEIHDRAETDLTTHTREIVEDLNAKRRS